jgi:hypothetical protein
MPQYWPPDGVQLEATQLAEPQTLATPAPPQVWPDGQALPQSSEPPQPSPMTPQ